MRMLPERKMMQKVKKNDEGGGDLSHMLILPGLLLGQNHFKIYHSIMHLSVCIVEKWILLYNDYRALWTR